ncbi:hypothetical protein BBJ28_00019768 [Nothophytophthora sp. Chile5]|nr:hypothetical protein BBJ28_00019768 [Nothophytophthora sp. Chile5]
MIARSNNRSNIVRIITAHEIERPSTSVDSADSSGVARSPSQKSAVKQDWFLPSREIRKDKEPFSFGSFGKVYRGWWLSSRVVIKCVAVETESQRCAFQREARIWQKARHPNIVPFFGACDDSTPYSFVCEEATNGNLMNYLFREQKHGRSLVWRKLVEAALGLHFLHERHIVHSDLKCNQILVSKDGVAMLTDFGLSFNSEESSGEEEVVGAIRWKAPECIRKSKPSKPNFQSDVYSFGMCVVEAVTGAVPWGPLPDPVVKFHVTREKFLVRPPAFKSDAQWEFVKAMCAFDPSKRLELVDAISQLRKFAEDEAVEERVRAFSGEAKLEPDVVEGTE